MQPQLNITQIQSMLRQEKNELVCRLLRSTVRTGIEKVIDFMNRTDFFTAPASSKFHSNYEGGLVDHSLTVYVLAMSYADVAVYQNPELSSKTEEGSIILTSLLHDICKTCLYVQTPKWKKDANDQWVQYLGYEINDTFPIGHGEKSVIMLQNLGLELRPDEMLAIRYHMGMYDDVGSVMKRAQFSASEMTPLVPILQMADYTATCMMEKKVEQ